MKEKTKERKQAEQDFNSLFFEINKKEKSNNV